MNGDYCCKYNQEKAGGGYPSEISSGTCDGIGFNRESTCCKDNAYQSCQTKGCFDYQGNINRKIQFFFSDSIISQDFFSYSQMILLTK